MQHYVFKKSLYSVLRYLCSTFSSVIQYLKYLRTQMMFINSMKKSQEFSFEMPPLSIYLSGFNIRLTQSLRDFALQQT